MANLKIFTDNIEDQAREQIDLLLSQEAFKDCKVRIMPDVHAGTGCVIGFTADLGDKVIPNIVGVDIGCGVLCVRLGKADIDLEKLDKYIKENVPSGMEVHAEFDETCKRANEFIEKLYCYDQLRNKDRLALSLGTLGGGNHFIEIDEDEEENKYLVIHTGSRNLGKQVAEIYQQIAYQNCNTNKVEEQRREIIKRLKAEGRQREIQTELAKFDKETKDSIPKDLCYLEGKNMQDYLHDMEICQKFATSNRWNIATIIMKEIFYQSPTQVLDIIESVHNYLDFTDHIVRKGAIKANKGQMVIIPLNMRDGCIIGVGKGNEDWNNSAPHGAGRLMSRMEARRELKVEDFEKAMNGIYTTTADESTIDESPMAYKNAQEIINAIGDTVEIIKIIKPIYSFKASDLIH